MIALSLCLVACSSPVAANVVKSDKTRITSPQITPVDLERLISGNSTFALDLYQQLKIENDNLFYSPYSISLMLAMAYAGANGETKSQIAGALDFTLPDEVLHSAMN